MSYELDRRRCCFHKRQVFLVSSANASTLHTLMRAAAAAAAAAATVCLLIAHTERCLKAIIQKKLKDKWLFLRIFP